MSKTAEDIERRLINVKEPVDWENPPTVEQLKADYVEALQSHTKHVSNVDEWLKALTGEHNNEIKFKEGRSRIKPKLVRKQAEWRYPALEEPFLSTEDMFTIKPVTALDVEAAYQNQLILNKQFRTDIPKVKFINEYVRTAVNTGTVVLKLGWKVEEGEVREQIEVPKYAAPEEAIAILQQQIQEGAIATEQAQQMLESGEQIQIGTELKEQTTVKEVVNAPIVEIRDSRMVVIDPSCEGDITKAMFVVDRFITDLSTLRKDKRYKNLENIRPSDHSPIYEADPLPSNNDNTFNFQDVPRKKIMVYEYWGYWDINNTGIVEPIVAAYIGDTMIRLDKNPFPDKKLPFVVVQYLPVPKSVYGEADAALLEDNQAITGAVTRGILDLFGRSANGQRATRKDALDVINHAKMLNGEDFEVNSHINNMEDVFYMYKYPEVPTSAFNLLSIQSAEAEALTGIKAFSNGITGNALGTSVGGIRSALDATAKRELGILRRLSQGLVEVGKKIVAMNSVWLSDEEIIRITDEDFVAIKRDDLAGNFDLSLAVSTAEADNQKAGELSYMLQTTGNSLPFEFTQMTMVEIAQLRKMPAFAKKLQNYKPEPDPLAQAEAQLRLELLKAQVANEMAKAKENEVDVQLKSAKTQTELAKGRTLQSEADMTDLGYVKEANGINLADELEKIKAKEEAKGLAEMPVNSGLVMPEEFNPPTGFNNPLQ
jgi:hypothetical protein